jgi:hypothetical protein
MRLENEQKTSRNKLKDSSMDRMEGERRKLLVMLRHGRIS